jgi:hypothetical protein
VGPTFTVGRQRATFAKLSSPCTRIHPLGIFLASAVLLTLGTNSIALAECGPGRVATYADVESIYVERRPVAGPNYKTLVTRRGEVLYIGRRHVPDIGTFDGDDGSALFEQLVAILKARDFYAMQLRSSALTTPVPKASGQTVWVDGPDDHVALLRCGVSTKVETHGMNDSFFLSNNPDDPQTKLFVELVDALQVPILKWPWRKEHLDLHPTPHASSPR